MCCFFDEKNNTSTEECFISFHGVCVCVCGSTTPPIARRPCFGAAGYRPGDTSGTFRTMTPGGGLKKNVAECEDPFQYAAHVRGWSDGCAEFPILTVTRRNLTAALPAMERFLDLPDGSLSGKGRGGGGGGRSKRGGGRRGGKRKTEGGATGGGASKGEGRGGALEALAVVSHAEDRRHSPWMDPAEGLDRLERGLYAYNMKRLFRNGLNLQRNLAAAPAPRLSPHAPSGDPEPAVGRGGARDRHRHRGGAGGGGGDEWATLVGRRIDAKTCRVVGSGAMAARALGTNRGTPGSGTPSDNGDGTMSLPSIDALVHSVFVSKTADEDEDNAGTTSGAAVSSARRRSHPHPHVAAPVEMCRGAGADNTVVYRLTRRHVELAVSRATGMGHNVCFHEAVAAEKGGSLEGDYDFTAQPPPPPEGVYVFFNATDNNHTVGEVDDGTTTTTMKKTARGPGGVAEAGKAPPGGEGDDSNDSNGNNNNNNNLRGGASRMGGTSTPAQDARWRQHLAVYSAFHRSALAGRGTEDARYLVLKLPPVFNLRREAVSSFVSTINAGEGASVSGLAAGRGGTGHTNLRPPSGAPFNLLLSAGLLALLSNRVLLVDFSAAPRLKGLLASPDGIDWDVDNALARGHNEKLLRPTRGDHPEHAGVTEESVRGARGGGTGSGGDGDGSVRWLCHSRSNRWRAEIRAGQSRRLCSAAEEDALRTRDVRKLLGGIGAGFHGREGDVDVIEEGDRGVGREGEGSGGGRVRAGEGGGGGIRSVVLDTEEVEGTLWRFVCGGGPTSLAKPGAHKMKVKSKSRPKKMTKGDIKAVARAKARDGGWADDDPGVAPHAAAAQAEDDAADAGLPPNPYHANWCRELFGDSPEAVGGRLFSWLVRPAGPLKTALQSYFKRVLTAGFTVGVLFAHPVPYLSCAIETHE